MKTVYGVKKFWHGPHDEEANCFYCRGVGCAERDMCVDCGWNPLVSLMRIRDRYGIKAVDALSKESSD